MEDINLRACALQGWNYALKQTITVKWNSIHDTRENRVEAYNIGRGTKSTEVGKVNDTGKGPLKIVIR